MNYCYQGEKEMLLGERRRVEMDVWLADKTRFTTLTPAWELVLNGVTEDSGSCTAVQDGDAARWTLTAEVEPQKVGSYKLYFTFGLGTEVIKRVCNISVKK